MKKKPKTKRNPADDTGRNSKSYRRRIGQLEMDFKKLEFMLEIQDKQIETILQQHKGLMSYVQKYFIRRRK